MSATILEQINEMILGIVSQLVERPENITVTTFEGQVSAVIEIRVPKSEVGRVIGKQGQNIEAIRLLTRAAGRRAGLRCLVEVPQ